MQGNCSQPYPSTNSFKTENLDTPYLPQKPGQCLVLFSCTIREKYCPWFHFFITDPSRSQPDDSKLQAAPLWFDNMSIRAMGGGGSSIVTYRDLWMTNVTMQWSNPHTSMWPGPLWAVGNVHVEGELLIYVIENKPQLQAVVCLGLWFNEWTAGFSVLNCKQPSECHSDGHTVAHHQQESSYCQVPLVMCRFSCIRMESQCRPRVCGHGSHIHCEHCISGQPHPACAHEGVWHHHLLR